jgi:hypothetical protein
MGLAYNAFDEKTTQTKRRERSATAVPSRAPDDKADATPPAWRADAASGQAGAGGEGSGRKGRRRRKNVYRTVDEIRADAAARDDAAGSSPAAGRTGLRVVDMTGPEARVVEWGADGQLKRRVAATGLHFPELRHNVRMIVDAAGTRTARARDREREREKERACCP